MCGTNPVCVSWTGSLKGNKYTYTADRRAVSRRECTLDGEVSQAGTREMWTGECRDASSFGRQPPTLGAKPPAGAVVLFDGTNFDKWVSFGSRKGAINIIDAIGNAQDAVAYLRAKIWSPQAQKATLQLGSDDGVKVWLNGKQIHANNAARGVTADEDKVAVSLQQGVNELLLKVTNGGG